MFGELADMLNEPDVEHKFAWPLLTLAPPHGLGFLPSEIRPQARIPKLFDIDKGAAKIDRAYIPDHLVQIAGLPVLILEVKRRDENVLEGFRQARLYANELNALYETIDPCQWVVATNGEVTLVGFPTQAKPKFQIKYLDAIAVSTDFAEFIKQCSRETLERYARKLRVASQPKPGKRPVARIGGDSAQNTVLPSNPIGRHLASNYRHIFDPQTMEDRLRIVREAYVHSIQRDEHASSINQLISSAIHEREHEDETLSDSSNPEEIFATLRKKREDLIGEFMFLIGSKGCGKSTFVDYLSHVKLPADIGTDTIWVRLNLNFAPQDVANLESWLIERITQGLSDHLEITRQVLEKIFGQRIHGLKQTELFEIQEGSKEYKQILGRKLEEWRSDKLGWMKALGRYLCDEHNRLLVVVFDNCDKLDSLVQLRVFESAIWVRAEINCFILLAMRDVTYEVYSSKPPLDTNQNTFRYYLDPPLFPEVLKKRVNLILDDEQKNATKGSFKGPMGSIVEFGASEVRSYIDSLFDALYQHNPLISGLLHGLSGRNIRTAIELFTRFCQSPYMSGPQLFQVKATGGKLVLDKKVVLQALMRGARKYYKEDDTAVVRNLFQLCHESLPDHFVRWSILYWLDERRHLKGPSGAIGLHRYSDLAEQLLAWGHDIDVISRECALFLKAGLIDCEHREPVLKSDADLIRISPSGIVHLHSLLTDPIYIGSCAEDTKIREKSVAEAVAERLGKTAPGYEVSEESISLNAWDFLCYLEDRQVECRLPVNPQGVMVGGPVYDVPIGIVRQQCFPPTDKKIDQILWREPNWASSRGSEFDGRVVRVIPNGLLIQLHQGPRGIANKIDVNVGGLKVGERIRVKVTYIDTSRDTAYFSVTRKID